MFDAIIKKIYHNYAFSAGNSIDAINRWIKTADKIIKPVPLFANKISIIYVNGRVCYVISPYKPKIKKAIMYIHGGAFISQITHAHWLYIQTLVFKSGVTAYVPIYPLSKENYSSCDDTLEMLINLYKQMLTEHGATNISIMGESAGGHLTLVLAQQAKIQHLPSPKNLICFSPGVDLNVTKKQIDNMVKKEPILPAAYIYYGSKWFVKKGDNPKKPIYSPINGDCKNIGYIILVVGTEEALLKPIQKFHQKLLKQQIKHTYIETLGMYHAYPIFPIHEAKPVFKLTIETITK